MSVITLRIVGLGVGRFEGDSPSIPEIEMPITSENKQALLASSSIDILIYMHN